MNYLAVRNWDKFQHYKKDNPLWIKLHRTLLNDYEFNQLSELQRGRLMRLWLLAAELNNQIPNDPKWVARAISASSCDLSDLISRGFLEVVYTNSREALDQRQRRDRDIKNTSSEHVDNEQVEDMLEPLRKAHRGAA